MSGGESGPGGPANDRCYLATSYGGSLYSLQVSVSSILFKQRSSRLQRLQLLKKKEDRDCAFDYAKHNVPLSCGAWEQTV